MGMESRDQMNKNIFQSIVISSILIGAAAQAIAQTVTAVTNVASGAAGRTGSRVARITDDGSVVVFETDAPANGLVGGVTEGNNGLGVGFGSDVFIKNLNTNVVSLVSRQVAAFGSVASGCPNCATTKSAFEHSYFPVITPDARWVLYGTYNAAVYNGNDPNPYNSSTGGGINSNSGVSVTGQTEDNTIPNGVYPIRADMLAPATPVARNAMAGSGAGPGVPGFASTNTETPNSESNAYATRSVITPDARYISFISTVNNLQGAGAIVQIDPPCCFASPMVWRADMNSNPPTYLMLSKKVGTNATFCSSTGNHAGNWVADSPHMSADGTRVVFHTGCNDLLAGYAQGAGRTAGLISNDVYLWDSGTLKLISGAIGSATQGGNGNSSHPEITPDGRFIIFQSRANNLRAGLTIPAGTRQLYLYEIATTTLTLISHANGVATTGSNGDVNMTWVGNAPHRWISWDDRFIAYTSLASNLDGFGFTDTNGLNDIYQFDRLTGTNRIVSLSTAGAQSPAGSSGHIPEMSASGRRMVFDSVATATPNLGFTVPISKYNIFARDIGASQTLMVSPQSGSTTNAANGDSDAFKVTADGTKVAITSDASNLVAGDTNAIFDAFVTTLPGVGPSVKSIDDSVSTIFANEVYASAPTILAKFHWEVRFKSSDRLSATNDAAANYVDDINNYLLVSRSDGQFPLSASCAAPNGTDTIIALTSASYSRTTFISTLTPSSFPANSTFKLLVCAANRTNAVNSIRDAANQFMAADVASNNYSSSPIPTISSITKDTAGGAVITEAQTINIPVSAVIANTTSTIATGSITGSTVKLLTGAIAGSGCTSTGTTVPGAAAGTASTVGFTPTSTLGNGNYRLIDCGTLFGNNRVPLGSALDANNVPGAGVDFVRNFTINIPSVLGIAKSHTGNFTQGTTGQWSLVVTNSAPFALGVTQGTTTVSDTLPSGYTLNTFSGAGWNCTSVTNVVTCTSTNVVAGVGGTFPTLVLTVNVPAASPISVNNTGLVFGGGDAVHLNLGTAAASNSDTVTVNQVAASITLTAGSGQSTAVNTAFATTLQATVRDAGSVVISGLTVVFTAPNPLVNSGLFANTTNTTSTTTTAAGLATATTFTANSIIGSYNVLVTAGPINNNFALTNIVGPPATMTANAGTTPQSTVVSTAFANALAVTVRDSGSNPVSGVNVTFTAPGAGASGIFSNSTATIVVATNASGVAAAPFTANGTAGGAYTVTAMATGLTTVNFSLTNTVGAPATMTANAGTTPQSATISTAFANALAVTVRDSGNNPVSGVNVTFTAPGAGASGIFSNSTATIVVATNASGVAAAPFTANSTVGGAYTVTAMVTGLTTVNFSLDRKSVV